MSTEKGTEPVEPALPQGASPSTIGNERKTRPSENRLDHIDVVNVQVNTSQQLKEKLNRMLRPHDRIISVVMTRGGIVNKDFIVVIERNVAMSPIKKVFR
jgi:hypothetical protein